MSLPSPSPLDPWFPPAASDLPAPKPLRAIGIVGGGSLATGLAHWCAAKGFGVVMHDEEAAVLTQAVARIRELFREMEGRNEITHADAHKAMGGIGITTGLEDMEFCDLLVDLVEEDAAAKGARFAGFAGVMPPESVLATAADEAVLAALEAATPGAERLIGLKFSDPVSASPEARVTIAAQTSRETAERVLGFVAALDKQVALRGVPRRTV